MTTASLIVGICGVTLGGISLGWQVANYLLTGGRVKVELKVGAVGNGGLATRPVKGLHGDWRQRLAEEGFAPPVVIVEVVNVGRQPVTVIKWNIAAGKLNYQPIGDAQGPPLPHRLEVGEPATWFTAETNAIALIESSKAVPRFAGRTIRGMVQLADGRKVVGRERFTP